MKKTPIKSLSGKDLKIALTLMLQVVADAKSAEKGDLQTLYERIQCNAEDIENFLSHPERNLFDKKLLIAIKKESEQL